MNSFNKLHPRHWIPLVTRDWKAKLGSLGLAFVLWWFVYSQTSIQRVFYVPIRYVNLPPHLTILKTNDTMARVIIQGQKDRVMNVKSQQIHALVDLAEVSPGWVTNQIQITTTELDPSLSVNLSQATVVLLVDSIQVVSLPVVPRISTPDKGYEIASIETFPSSVIVKGPARLLTNLSSIETPPLDLQGVHTSITTNMALLLPPGVLALDTPSNRITIQIRATLSNTPSTEEP